MEDRNWYQLDNIGKFYSSIASLQPQNIFRYSITLKEEIKKDFLTQALKETISIFPNFNVNLKKGLFWYYLEETEKTPEIKEENLPICYQLYKNSKDYLYRISFYKKRINLEVSHILSDGKGSLEFFKLLISNYLKITYQLQEPTTNSSYYQKIEDSFKKYYQKEKTRQKKYKHIYTYQGKKIKGNTKYLELHLSLKEVILLAHQNNATLTSYLISILIDSIKEILTEQELKKTIKIDVPVDLRQFFNSSTSKNYFGLLPITYKFQTRNDSFKHIIKEVKKQFKQNLTKNNIKKRANQMVKFEKNFFYRFIPLPLKQIVLAIIHIASIKKSTTCFSNVGKIEFDPIFATYIENINATTSTPTFQFTICSFKDDLSVSISSKYHYNEIIKNFCLLLKKQNLKMYLIGNEVE